MTATKELYVRARPVIDRVLELTRARQSSLVSEACGADEELARFVRSLLKRQDQVAATDDDIDVLNVLSVSLDEDATPEELGSYKILGRLGAGGMSVVYLAEQPNPRRLVALKVLRRAVSAELLQHEVETLALLRHPGIAQVFEAGIAATPDGGKPFFVMEFVSSTGDTKATTKDAGAQTLADYMAERISWGVRDRLEIFARVCDAVNYAHKRGVIHRDLKPTNVLVDHLGQPKVIDFGIAMFAGPQHVASGGPLANVIAGTIPFMSPEQLRGDASKIDLRSDVYALGVMAFQVLAGSLPYDGLTGEPEKDTKIIQQGEPISLSSRSTVIPRDVDAIVAKAIAKDLDTRYQTAADLATDIRRFIVKKTVSARRNTPQYRLACLLRRRPVISAATILALTLIGAAAFRAYMENAGAKDALKLLVTGITKADTISVDGSLPTLTGVLDSVAQEVDARTALHRDAAASIHLLLGTLYLRADPRGRTAAKAGTHYQRAAKILESEYGRADERVLSARNNVAVGLNKGGHSAEAAALLEEIIPLRERAGDRRGAIVSRGNYAAALLRLKRTEEAIGQFETVFQRFIEAGDKHGALAARAWEARALMDAGYLADAETLQREALQRSLKQGSDYVDLSLAIMDGLTHCLIYQSKWNDAEVELRSMRNFAERFAAPENGMHQAILAKLLRVQRDRGDQPGYLATLKELEAWEAMYGNGS